MTIQQHAKNWWGPAAVSFILFILMTACGGGDAPGTSEAEQPAPAESAQNDLCDLLTEAEIEEALGAAPMASSPGDSSCEWAAPEGSDPLIRLRLTSSNLMSYADFVAEFNAEFGGEEPDREEYMPVEGIGDWAMFVADGHILEAHIGERMLRVQTSAGSLEAATMIAELALPRVD